MTMPRPELDDRRFQDIVDEAKRRIPLFCPEWTNHNVSDPGVALIELFAWMTEITLFRVNQLPDRLYSAFLDLVGIEPLPAMPARADLTFWLSAVQPTPVEVPEGTPVATMGWGGEPPVFRTLDKLTISQPELQAYGTTTAGGGFRDRTIDLNDPTAVVPCFESLHSDDAFLVGFRQSICGNVIRLDVTVERAEGAGVRPEQPPIVWETWTEDGWARIKVRDDATGGINRDGGVTLVVPLSSSPKTLGDAQGLWWLRCRLLAVAPGQPTYQSTPLLRSLTAASVGGSVSAVNVETAGRSRVGYSNGRPGQRFALPHSSVAPIPPLTDKRVVEVVHAGKSTQWRIVDDFRDCEPEENVVAWSHPYGEIRFGPNLRYPDGQRHQLGAVPPEDAEIYVSGYQYGGGNRGNVDRGALVSMRTTVAGISGVENFEPASGGVDAEDAENAKQRAPMTLRTSQRAVTGGDYERIVLDRFRTLARAHCLPPRDAGGPIRLLVVPVVPEPALSFEIRPENRVSGLSPIDHLAISPSMADDIARHLEAHRTIGATIRLGTPYYQAVSVAARITALRGRQTDLVAYRVAEMLNAYINPITGGPDGTGWPLGTDLNVGSLFQLLGTVDGVARVDDVLLFSADARLETRNDAPLERVRLAEDSLFVSFKHRVVAR